MIDLYSIKETSKIFGLRPSQLRYWTQTGFVAPTIRRGGRLYYTFRDLVGVKAAKELLASGVSMESARPKLEYLRKNLPARVIPSSMLSICSDGDTIEVSAEDDPSPPTTQDVVMAFRLSTLASQIADALGRSASPPHNDERDVSAGPTARSTSTDRAYAPVAVVDHRSSTTERHEQPSAYECFRSGFDAEREGEHEAAELWYSRALSVEPTLAAAQTNLGNVHYGAGDLDSARSCYESALEHDPDQPEARYNLGNLLDELGETDLAIAELRAVTSRHPDFADAHYNLGLVLHRVGGAEQARTHLERYLELDTESDWAQRARSYIADNFGD